MTKRSVSARAPASVANICCGYDILGFAMDAPADIVTATFADKPGIVIDEIKGDDGVLSHDPTDNMIGIVAQAFLDQIEDDRGVVLSLTKEMSIGSGLGSSAASAVAAALAMNGLFNQPLSTNQLLETALFGEQAINHARHLDNVAPSLYGGLVLIKSVTPADVYPIEIATELHAAVVHPDLKIITRESRALLSKYVTMQQLVAQTANVAGFVLAMQTGDLDLLEKSLQDVIIEPQRCQLIPPYQAVKDAAIESGAIGCGISGSGPSMFALCETREQAKTIGQAMQAAFSSHHLKSDCHLTSLKAPGGSILS